MTRKLYSFIRKLFTILIRENRTKNFPLALLCDIGFMCKRLTMKALISIALLFILVSVSAQENCLNGIDDDGDGLIDLNDTEDCDCFEPVVLEIFEDYNSFTCCPTLFTTGPGTGIYCLIGGWTLVGGTSDYFNTCGYLGGDGIPLAPQPFPSEGGMVGGINTPTYNEYIGYCLPGEMKDLESYTYSMYIGFNDMATTWNSVIPTDIGIFGTTDCSTMDDFNFDCLENQATWQLIESFTVGGNMGEWTYVTGTFVNDGNYAGIAFGPTCQNNELYTFYDDFSIEGVFNIEEFEIEDDITESGTCVTGITLAVSNMPGLSYQWYLNGIAISGATDMTYDVPPGQEGDYQVMIYDSNGCGIYDPYTLIINENILDIDADIMNVQCFEEADGSISLDLSGGNQPYDVMWLGGEMTSEINGLEPGSYPVTITDANGCIDITSFTVGGPSGPLEIEVVDIQQPKGLIEVATASVDVSGGTQDYTITWSNLETGFTATNLMPGFHTVTVVDANGCEATTDLTIHPPLVVELVFQNISCFDCDGSIDITVSGGLPDYTIEWNTGAGGFSISDLCEQEYTYLITDAFGTECFGFQYIDSQAPIEISEVFYSEFICFGETTGDIDISVDGGSPDYSYMWSNGFMEQDLVSVPAGNYTLVVTDDLGCTQEAFYSITALQEIEVDYETVEVDCASGLGGEISLFIGGGLPNYTVDWSNSMQGETISGLSAGNYSAVITDANGCTAEVEVFLSGSSDLTFTPEIVNASCAGIDNGSITVDVQGSGMVSFLWEDMSTENSIDSLSAGSYSLVVTDEAGCTTQLSYEVGTDDSFEIVSNYTDTLCYGEETGFINLDIISGDDLSFMWDGGSEEQNLSMLGAGDYQVVVTDANQCALTFDFTIVESDEIVVVPTILDEECVGESDGSLTIAATGGTGSLSYEWEDGTESNTLSGLSLGNYVLTVTDGRGCTYVDSFDIGVLSNIAIDAMVIDAGCQGESTGEIDLMLAGGSGSYTVVWDSGQETEDIDNLSSGDYEVVVTDELGCMATAIYTVGSGANVLLEVEGENLLCFEDGTGEITITVTGGAEPISYFLNGQPANSINTNLSADSYLIEIIDADGCETSSNITLMQPPVLSANVVSTTDVDVSGFGTATIFVEGGTMPYVITWDNGEMGLSATMLTAGMHTVTIIDANNCERILEVEIGSTILNIDFDFTENACFGDCNGTIDITVLASTGQVSFTWDNGMLTPSLMNLCNGPYVCIVEDEAGNMEEVSVLITSNDEISITPMVEDVGCFGESTGVINVSAAGGSGTYDVFLNGEPGSTNNTDLPADDYVVEVVDDLGCSMLVNVEITSPDALVVTGSTTGISCFDVADGSISLEIEGGTGPYSTSWSSGITDPEDLEPGTYDLTVLDANNCETSASFVIEGLELPEVDLLTIDPNCDDLGAIQLLWDDTYPVLLNGQSTAVSGDGFIENLSEGSYVVSYLYADNCEVEIEEVDLELEDFLLNGVMEQTIQAEFGETITLDISTLSVNGAFTTSWNLENTYVCTQTDIAGNCISLEILVEQNEEVELLVENTAGCRERFSFRLELIRSDNVYIPNIITGRLGEKFKFFAQSDLAELKSFGIYDRWGERIYTENNVFINTMEGWDLQYNGQDVIPGVYVYYAEIAFPDGRTETLAGDITVIF